MKGGVLVVGGADVDLFLPIEPQNPHFKFDPKDNELSVHLGDKVLFKNANFAVGGNAANVSVGLKRLGINSSIMTDLGSDEFAKKILDTLKSEGVDVSNVKKSDGPSSFSVVLTYKDDRTILAEKAEALHRFNFDNISVAWVYLTSLGGDWEAAYKNISNFLEKSKAKLAFNPGSAQIEKGLESFSYLLPKTQILILNKEEAEKLINDKGLMMNDLLLRLKQLGPKIVVVTDGENGSDLISDSGEILHQDALKVDVVSAAGAGDAYSSGFLAAVILGKPLQDAMIWGSKNAASVVGKIGAEKGLLKAEEIDS